MATINVILQAKARDKGVHKWLTQATKLADGFAESLGRAKTAMGGLGSGSLGSLAAAGRGGRGGARAGGGRDTATSVDKAERQAQRASERAQRTEERNAQRQATALARAGQQRVRASQRAAKNLESLSDEQLKEREIQREINARRSRAARISAKESLGADPTKPKMGPFGKLEFAENLAVAGGEFDRFGNKVEQGIRSSFDAFKDYEKKVAEIGTITEAVSLEQIDTIAKAAVGEFGGKPIKQAEALQKVMSMGAATAVDAQAQLMEANKLAIAGSADITDSVAAISKAMANFKGVDATQVADSIFAVTQASSAEVGDLAQSLPRIAAGASAAGLTLEETVGTIGQLSNKLPDANQAVTGMIQMLSNIQKPTKRARAEAKRLGIDFSVAGIEAAGGWEEFLLKLRASEKFDENTLSKLFESSEARNAVAAITEDMEGLRKNLAAQESAAGGTEKAYAKMTDTAAHKAALLEGQWETLKIQAGSELVPVLLDVAEFIGPIITKLRDWTAENPNTARTLAKLAVGTVVMSKAVGGLVSAYSMWQTISAITQLGNMKLSGSTDTLTTAVTKQGTAMSKTAKGGSGLSKFVGALPGAFGVASAAIVAFNVVLDEANQTLDKYDKKLDEIEEQQKNIKFQRDPTAEEKAKFEAQKAEKIAALQEQRKSARGKERKLIDEKIAAAQASTLKPIERSDEELLMERRNRLIAVVNAAREKERTGSGGAAWETLTGGDALGGFTQLGAGLFNRASGTQDDFEMQRIQAERDLAEFDRLEGAKLNLGDDAFTMPETGLNATLAALQDLVKATQTVAANTAPRTTGPSMEAGLS